jgi:hypothetical protein
MKACAQTCIQKGIDFIVVGDTKSPADFNLDGCKFISIDEQMDLGGELARLLPTKHYTRKNVGYLLAKDCQVISETDDDNFPLHHFFDIPPLVAPVRTLGNLPWINVYREFTHEHIWPRGFALNHLQSSSSPSISDESLVCPIIQGLANDNPDVDAIYRLTLPLPFQFNEGPPVALKSNSYCPFNSQNTHWHSMAFLLLYLPATASFRMTDIWRSFIAQRILWTCGWNLKFIGVNVTQARNDHNLIKDFEDEVQGYLHNDAIVTALNELQLQDGPRYLQENLLRCYHMMVKKNWLSADELPMVNAWCKQMTA